MQKDIVKGRIKEATGVMTGNQRLVNEGKTDQAVGKVKKATDKAVKAVEKKMRD